MDNNEYRDPRSSINPKSLTLYVIVPAIIVLGYWLGAHYVPSLIDKWWFCIFFGFGRIFAIISLIINGPLTVLRLLNMRHDRKYGK